MQTDVLVSELAQSWRTLCRNPGYLCLASLTLALGVAACVSVFSVVDASLLAPISIPHSESVVALGPLDGPRDAGGMSPMQFVHLENLPGTVTTGIASPGISTVNVSTGDTPTMIASWQVSDGFLKTLDEPMRLGRYFSSSETEPNGPKSVIVSFDYWRQSLGRVADISHLSIRIDGHLVPVVGVLPPDFPYHQAELLLPLALDADNTNWSGSYRVIARMLTAESRSRVAAAMQGRLHALDVQYKMDRFSHHNIYVVQSLVDALHASTGSQNVLTLFAICAGVILLIVTVNLANLSLLRILSRSHQNSIRQALGAPPGRLIFPVLSEQLLVATLGGALGLLLAFGALRLANDVIPSFWFVGSAAHPKLGLKGVIFSFLLGLFVAVLALLISVWRFRYGTVWADLREGGRTGGGRKIGRIGRALVILQASLATVLVIVAALCVRTLLNAAEVDNGFDGHNVLGFSVQPDRSTYPNQQSVLLMANALVARLEVIPGAKRAAYSTNIPASGTDHNDTAPFVTRNGNVIDGVAAYLVSPGYFNVLGVPLQQGVPFDGSQELNINSAMVSTDFKRTSSVDIGVGQELTLPLHSVNPAWENLALEIRGITKGVRVFGPEYDMPSIVWIPFVSSTARLYDVWRDSDNLYFVLRVRGNPATYQKQVMSAVHDLTPGLAVSRLQPLSEYQSAVLSQQRLTLGLVLMFAGAALLLSSVGLYSVMAVSVASRQREFAIRAAMGAERRRLFLQVLLDGGRQVAIGLVIGVGVAFAASHLIVSFVSAAVVADPLAIIVVLIVLLFSGLSACLRPALFAARVEPMRAFRGE